MLVHFDRQTNWKFVHFTGRRNQHDKAWKLRALVRLLIFKDVKYPARPRTQQRNDKVNKFGR